LKINKEDKFVLIKYDRSANAQIKPAIKELHIRRAFRQDDNFKFILIKDDSLFEKLGIRSPQVGDLYLLEKHTSDNLK
jgi:hypothetical protein